eukprot:3933640-Rhodomonas_salina.2
MPSRQVGRGHPPAQLEGPPQSKGSSPGSCWLFVQVATHPLSTPGPGARPEPANMSAWVAGWFAKFHGQRSWLKEPAPLNIESIVVTEEMSQREMSASKAAAFKNMESILVTAETSHRKMSGLKEDISNICHMYVTDETSQPLMSPLKAVAKRNIEPMWMTDDVSHPERSPLKAVAEWNIEAM